ncbi:flagellar motor switch protein FliG [Qingshengfaniella alkalisoli]|uniref:Flagellar motor switch protein FliG n=1 Tax=Qingshengfaniella alkalisoli TaxID=2599296 RepID=A0A5B8I8U5_9RHOB|nr:flagellar motor switch protein FliG [Qingshengfaniella alkalisoli]
MPATGSVQRPKLTRRQKAAVIVRLLLREGSQLSLNELPEVMKMDLTREMGTMGLVDRQTMQDIITEFVGELNDLGVSFPGGVDGALETLESALSPQAMREIRRKIGKPIKGDPWNAIANAPTDQVVALVRRESTEVAAVILSKLPVSRAADILGKLPGDQARRITFAISTTSAIEPDTVCTIGMAIAIQLDDQTPHAFAEAPVARIGAILNSSKSTTRHEVLEGLEQTDAEFAQEVRKAIFTFADIVDRVIPRDVPKIVRTLDRQLLLTALAGTTGVEERSAQYLLENISQRLATQIREEIEELAQINPADAEEAMDAVAAVIRDMEAAGELALNAAPD